MIKKISVFIMILGLFFVGIPQPNVKANPYDIDDQIYDEIFDAGTNFGYSAGLSDGYNEGYGDGYNDASLAEGDYWEGYDYGFGHGKTYGERIGYQKGLDETDATGFISLLTSVFAGLGALLTIEILPGIYIGAIIAVPLVFGIIFFILGKRKGD